MRGDLGSLRCVWELFTLCAFSSMDHVHNKIRFVPFSSAAEAAEVSTNGAVDALLQFSLAKAHCFDPNEENRLR